MLIFKRLGPWVFSVFYQNHSVSNFTHLLAYLSSCVSDISTWRALKDFKLVTRELWSWYPSRPDSPSVSSSFPLAKMFGSTLWRLPFSYTPHSFSPLTSSLVLLQNVFIICTLFITSHSPTLALVTTQPLLSRMIQSFLTDLPPFLGCSYCNS